MLPVPAVSDTADPTTSAVASLGVASVIEPLAERVTLLDVACTKPTTMSAAELVRLTVPVVLTLVATIVPFAVTVTLALFPPLTAVSVRPLAPTSLTTIVWFFCGTPAARASTSVSMVIPPMVDVSDAEPATMSAVVSMVFPTRFP